MKPLHCNFTMLTITRAVRRSRPVLAAICLLAAASAHAAESVRYEAQPGGSKMKLDGTSTLHDWSVECGVIGGFMELDASFPNASATAAPNAVKAKVETIVPVRSLKSGKKSMDAVMHDALKQQQHPRIEYKMLELTPTAGAAAGGSSSKFDARGALTVAGVTRTNTMPVTIERIDASKLKVSGSTALKMTEFGIKPPSPDIPGLGSLIKTGDDIKLTFEWITEVKAQ